MKVTAARKVQHLCPYRDEVDYGSVEITFAVDDGDAPEMHALSEHFAALSELRISHEDYTRRVLYMFDAARVVTRWKTAGMDVTCDLSSESDR